MTDASAREASVLLGERKVSLEKTVVRHPTHVFALESLHDCLARGRMRKDGKRLTARAQLVVGHSGAGKSTLIEDFADLYRDEETPDGLIRPVVVVEMPDTMTKRALVQTILRKLGYRSTSADSANSLVMDIADKVARLGVEMIILDEGQGVVRGTAVLAIAEFLKSLLNRVNCQIVIAGCPELLVLHQHSQLNRRLLPDISLLPYAWDTIEGRVEFLALLTELECNMLLPEPSNLASEELARRMYVASEGCIGTITKLLSEALTRATKRNLRSIDQALLAEVHASFEIKKQKPQPIAFDAALGPLCDATDENMDAMEARLRAPKIDAETNPFACARQELSSLWMRQIFLKEEAAKLGKRSRIKGVGPVLAPIFTD
jgi:hypothetical protein